MDEVAEIINALYEGHKVNTTNLGWRARVKFLRLQIVANYVGYRLLTLLGQIKDAEFMEILASYTDDSDSLLGDALEYSLEANVVALASFLEAVAIFAWYKAVEVRPLLHLCPRLLEHLDEIKAYVEDAEIDSRLLHKEETFLERQYAARLLIIEDYPQ